MSPTTDLPTGPPAHERNTYFGYLAADNIEHVFNRLREMIGDGRPFAFVAVNENMDMLRPEVQVTKLDPRGATDGEPLVLKDDHITIISTGYVTGFGTTEPVERAISREARQRLMSTCYFVFERGQFMVIQRTGAGGKVSWTIRPVE